MNITAARAMLLPLLTLACSETPSMDSTTTQMPTVPGTTSMPSMPPTEEGCPVGIEEGECPPDFTLLNADGTPVRLADRVGDRLVVVGSSLW